MTFKQALKKLRIEDYGQRIFSSNSRGELFHLWDYIDMAEQLKDPTWFRGVFLAVVEYADKNWKRPDSCFQHMPKLISEFRSDQLLLASFLSKAFKEYEEKTNEQQR